MSILSLPKHDLVFPQAPTRVARAFPCHPRSGWTMPVHYWLCAALWAGVLMYAMSAIYVLEKYVFGLKGTQMRMAGNPAELAVRFFGLSHYVVATYLLLTSKKLHNLRGIAMLALFSLLAFAASLLFYVAGGAMNMLAVTTVFFFFLMHALRDEVFFYRLRSGPAISDEEYAHVYRMLIWLQTAGLSLLAGILYPAFIYKLAGSVRHARFNAWIDMMFPIEWPIAHKMLASSLPFLAVALFFLIRIHRRHPGGLLELLQSHRPLSIIVGGTVLTVLSSIALGSWVLDFVILMHFTGWFIFATVGIKKLPKEVQQAATWRDFDKWVRQNLTGFWVFHGGLAAIFFSLIAVNHWGMAQSPTVMRGIIVPNAITTLFNEHSLFYWTIVHCTLGFLPKPAPKRR